MIIYATAKNVRVRYLRPEPGADSLMDNSGKSVKPQSIPRDQSSGFLSAVINAIPSPILVVDSDLRILDFNLAASKLLGGAGTLILKRRGGEALHCLHSTETPGGCGHAPACKDCVIRNSVGEAFGGSQVSRKAEKLQLTIGDAVTEVNMLVTAAPIHYGDESLVLLVLEDINELVNLRRIVPICAGCRKIRNDQEYWEQVDVYFKERLDIDFSHGLCPDCVTRLYPELSELSSKKKP